MQFTCEQIIVSQLCLNNAVRKRRRQKIPFNTFFHTIPHTIHLAVLAVRMAGKCRPSAGPGPPPPEQGSLQEGGREPCGWETLATSAVSGLAPLGAVDGPPGLTGVWEPLSSPCLPAQQFKLVPFVSKLLGPGPNAQGKLHSLGAPGSTPGPPQTLFQVFQLHSILAEKSQYAVLQMQEQRRELQWPLPGKGGGQAEN